MHKVLIIKHGSLGDIISSTAVIKPIKDYYKKSEIIILTSNNYLELFKKSNLSNSLLEDNRKGFLNFIIIIFKIISIKFDLIIDLQNSKRSLLYCLITRIFTITKINGTHIASHYRFRYDKKNPPHVIKGLGDQINILGIKSLERPYLNWLKKENFNISELRNQKFFIVNPGCSNLSRKWSPKKFAEVCSFLVSKKIIPVVIGAGNDINSIQVIQNIENKILNLYNKSPLDVIYNLSLNALGALSNDTGPAHIIAAANCKIHLVLSTFSENQPTIPQSENVSFTKSNSIDEITSSQIINKINLFL